MTHKRTCSLEGCDNRHSAKGLCKKHYTRLLRHGDPTIVHRNDPSATVKRCRDCGETKALEEFPRSPSTLDGRGSYCSPCHRMRVREWQVGPGREKSTAAAQRYRRSPQGLAARAEQERRRRLRSPEKIRAREAVKEAVKRGRLQRPSVCSSCGSTGRVEGHHHAGYEPKMWLAVTWLCRPCHNAVHRQVAAA